MKKTFTQADGTQVVIEGTPEEIAEFERKVSDGSKSVSIEGKHKGKKLLTEEEVRVIAKEEAQKEVLAQSFRDAFDRARQLPYVIPIPCERPHIPMYPYNPYGFWWGTTTGNDLLCRGNKYITLSDDQTVSVGADSVNMHASMDGVFARN